MVETLPIVKWREGVHGRLVAKTGHGKSVVLERVAETAYESGYKVIDIWDSGSFENCFYQFKSKWRDYWKDDEVKSYPIEVYHPICFSDNFPKEIPKKNFFLYTVPISDIRNLAIFRVFYSRDFGFSLGSQNLFKRASRKSLSKFFLDLKRYSSKGYTKSYDFDPIGKLWSSEYGLSTIGHVIRMPFSLGMISNPDFKIGKHGVIDLTKILLDNKTMTAFSQAFVPDFRMKLWNVLYILVGIWERIRTGELGEDFKLMLNIRDLWNLLPSSSQEAYKKIVVEQVQTYLFEARKFNCSMWVDYQTPEQIVRDPTGQFSYTFIGRLKPEETEKMGSFSQATKRRIETLPRSKWYVIEPSGRAFFRESVPNRSMHREAGVSFFETLKEHGVEFEPTDYILDAKREEDKTITDEVREWWKRQAEKFKKKEEYDTLKAYEELKREKPDQTQAWYGVELAKRMGRVDKRGSTNPFTQAYISQLETKRVTQTNKTQEK